MMCGIIIGVVATLSFWLGWLFRAWKPGVVRRTNPRRTSVEDAVQAYQDVHWGAPDTMPDEMVDVADPRERNFPVLGELVEVVYATDKGEGIIEYEHRFQRPRPLLMFSSRTKRLLIGGGAYTVNERGVVG